MYIVLAILGALAAAFWAFTHFVNAANQSRDAVRDVKGVLRRGQWNRRIDQRLIENLSDPREAAAIMLYQIVAYDGAVTGRQHGQIIADMRAAFDADEETGESLLAFARMAVGELNDAGNSVRKILRSVADVCSPDEKAQLVAMMERAAEIEGAPTDMQRRLISEVRRVLIEA